MIDALALAIAVVSLGTALSVGVQAAGAHFRRARLTPTLVALQIALSIQALADVAALARGHHPRETSTHVAYLVVSVIVVPIAGYETRRDDGRWSAILLVIALLVLAVLVVRLQVTWRSARG